MRLGDYFLPSGGGGGGGEGEGGILQIHAVQIAYRPLVGAVTKKRVGVGVGRLGWAGPGGVY